MSTEDLLDNECDEVADLTRKLAQAQAYGLEQIRLYNEVLTEFSEYVRCEVPGEYFFCGWCEGNSEKGSSHAADWADVVHTERCPLRGSPPSRTSVINRWGNTVTVSGYDPNAPTELCSCAGEIERLRAALQEIEAVAWNHDEGWIVQLARTALRPTSPRPTDG